jgi:hypothetical protein
VLFEDGQCKREVAINYPLDEVLMAVRRLAVVSDSVLHRLSFGHSDVI